MARRTKNQKEKVVTAIPTEPAAGKVLTPGDVSKLTTQSPNIQTVYFNHARVAAGYFDVRIFLGENSVNAQGEVSFTEQLCVVVTPEFAKLFMALLAAQMAQFQKLFGDTRKPPEGMILRSVEPATK